jgi:hypothetical protein
MRVLADLGGTPALQDVRRMPVRRFRHLRSEDAHAFLGSMGGARALSLATIDVVERRGRALCRNHPMSSSLGGGQRSLMKSSGPETARFVAMLRGASNPEHQARPRDGAEAARRETGHRAGGAECAHERAVAWRIVSGTTHGLWKRIPAPRIVAI